MKFDTKEINRMNIYVVFVTFCNQVLHVEIQILRDFIAI